MNKRVTVVIPCRNEFNYIETCLMSLLNNGYPKESLELLVIDGRSDDGTREVLQSLSEQYPQIKWIDNPKQKTPFALNLGIENATGFYTLISSAHASFEVGYISTLVDKIESSQVDVVGGVMETQVKNKTATSNAIQLVLAHPFGVGNAHFRTGIQEDRFVDTVPFGLYKTDLLRKHGGYDERLIRNHDIELSKRLLANRAKILLTPETKCVYYARETWSKMAKNNFDNGKWNLLTVAITRDFSSLSLRHFVPLVFVSALLFPLVFMVFSPIFAWMSLVVALTHISFVSFVVVNISSSNTTKLHLFASFKILHLSYGIGSLIGIFSSLPYWFKSKTR